MNQLDIDYALTVATETDNEYQEETIPFLCLVTNYAYFSYKNMNAFKTTGEIDSVSNWQQLSEIT